MALLPSCSTGPYFVAKHEPWRAQEERACLASGAVRQTPYIRARSALGGPSACGAELPFEMAAANGGRLKLYAGDGSLEYRHCLRELERARVAYRANRTMNFFVEPSEGHDDYLVSLALLVEAGSGAAPRPARGRGRGLS